MWIDFDVIFLADTKFSQRIVLVTVIKRPSTITSNSYLFQVIIHFENFLVREIYFTELIFFFAANIKDVDIEEFNNVMSVSAGGRWL